MIKKIASFFIIFFAFFGSFFTNAPVQADFSPDGIIVKYKNSEKLNVVTAKNSEDVEHLLGLYTNDPAVEYAEYDHTYQASIIPSDFYYKNQWYLKKIKAPDVWDEVRGSESSVIAVIDSGVQIDHPDLRDNLWVNEGEIEDNGLDDDMNGYVDDVNGWDFIENSYDPSPKFIGEYNPDGISHGTIIAGIAAAKGNNKIGISGVAWDAQIMSLRVLDSAGRGRTSSIAPAIDYAVKNGADIINLSFVGTGYNRSMETAIKRAYQAGVIVVAAAGNEQITDENGELKNGHNLDEVPLYPVCYDGDSGENMVIGVAATDALDQKAVFSGYGHSCIDISAPGVSIFSSVVYEPEREYAGHPFGEYYDGYWSGTSMAVPMVSGSLAMIEGINPGLSRDDIIKNLFNGADNISRLNPSYPEKLGVGRLNVYRSVLLAKFELEKKNPRIVTTLSAQNNGVINVVNRENIFENEIKLDYFSTSSGVRISTGDINGDETQEIITGAGEGGLPDVRIFSLDNKQHGKFLAYDKNFRGGVNVAAGDVDGDGVAEIVVGAGMGGGPQVRIFKGNGRLLGQFFAYDSKFRGGINVAVGDVDSTNRRNKKEIITAPMSKGGPHVRIFDEHSKFIDDFFAYDKNFRGGVNLSTGDMDKDGLDEIITGAASKGSPHVSIFEKNGSLVSSFYASRTEVGNGAFVAYYE